MFILMQQVAYEGGSLLGAFDSLGAALAHIQEKTYSRLPPEPQTRDISKAFRVPVGATALWVAEDPQQADVTYEIWAVAV